MIIILLFFSAKANAALEEVVEILGTEVPEINEEDLDKLVGYVKKITTLYELKPTSWNEDCEEVIKEFFLDPTQPALSVYFDNNLLKCHLGFPSCIIRDLTYFIRKPFEIFYPETFHDNIMFGTVDDNIEGSLLKVIENVYAPIFFNITTLPESILFKSKYLLYLNKIIFSSTNL